MTHAYHTQISLKFSHLTSGTDSTSLLSSWDYTLILLFRSVKVLAASFFNGKEAYSTDSSRYRIIAKKWSTEKKHAFILE